MQDDSGFGKTIPVQGLTAAVAVGLILTFYCFQAARADRKRRYSESKPKAAYGRNLCRNPIRDCFFHVDNSGFTHRCHRCPIAEAFQAEVLQNADVELETIDTAA